MIWGALWRNGCPWLGSGSGGRFARLSSWSEREWRNTLTFHINFQVLVFKLLIPKRWPTSAQPAWWCVVTVSYRPLRSRVTVTCLHSPPTSAGVWPSMGLVRLLTVLWDSRGTRRAVDPWIPLISPGFKSKWARKNRGGFSQYESFRCFQVKRTIFIDVVLVTIRLRTKKASNLTRKVNIKS